MSFEIVQGDLEPDMLLTCSVNGIVENISDSTARVMRWHKPDGTEVDVALTTVNLTLGQVKRVWVAGDTSIPGIHLGRIIVTRANGENQTFPSDGTYFVWWVHPSS